ncbi:hypothetical protein [Aeromonas veronii]
MPKIVPLHSNDVEEKHDKGVTRPNPFSTNRPSSGINDPIKFNTI